MLSARVSYRALLAYRLNVKNARMDMPAKAPKIATAKVSSMSVNPASLPL